MESSTAATPTGAAEGSGNAQGKRNLGRIEEIQGVVIEATFPERLPEIDHAITIQRTASNEEEEAAGVSASAGGDLLVCEVQQHLGDDRVRAVAMDTTDGLARGLEVVDTGAPISVPVGEVTLGRIFNLLGEPIDLGGPLPRRTSSDAASTEAPARGRTCSPAVEMFETGIKVIDLIAPLRQGRQDRAVRRRRRRQDRAHPGADPQHRHRARRLVGLRRRRRAVPRGQRPVAGDEGSGVIDKTMLVFGQMNEPPGARLRVALDRADHGRILPRPGPGRAAVHRQHLPLRAGRLRGLGPAGPHALRGRLPAHAGSRDGRSCRSASPPRVTGSVTSMQAIYVPADDLTDPAPASIVRSPGRDHRLSRSDLREGYLPGGGPAGVDLPYPRSRRRRRGALQVARGVQQSCSVTRSCRTSSRSSASTSSPTRTG